MKWPYVRQLAAAAAAAGTYSVTPHSIALHAAAASTTSNVEAYNTHALKIIAATGQALTMFCSSSSTAACT